MKNKSAFLLPLPAIALSAFAFSQVWSPAAAATVVFSLDSRPFIYRALIPLLARALVWAGLSPSGALSLLLIVFSLGLFFVMRALIAREGSEILAFLFVEGLLLFLIRDIKVYDVPTVFFFALSLLLLERGELSGYYLLFPFITLNRETSLFLSFFFALRFIYILPWRRYLLGLGYQAVVFIGIRIALERVFADRPGSDMLFRPFDVLRGYASEPVAALLLAGILGLLLWVVLRGWNEKPAGIRLALIAWLPGLLCLHFIAGYAFELRVLSESFAPLFLLALYPIQSRAGALDGVAS